MLNIEHFEVLGVGLNKKMNIFSGFPEPVQNLARTCPDVAGWALETWFDVQWGSVDRYIDRGNLSLLAVIRNMAIR